MLTSLLAVCVEQGMTTANKQNHCLLHQDEMVVKLIGNQYDENSSN
jgi:hypothetical protein